MEIKKYLKEYALLAEIIGAIAVVISLIYVGSGIRQNTSAIQVTNHQSSIALGMELGAWMRDAEFAETYELALRDFSQLTTVQKLQFDSYVGNELNIWEFGFYTHYSGMMSDEIWSGWDRWFRSEINQESFRTLWLASKRVGYGEDFRIYVDSTIINAE